MEPDERASGSSPEDGIEQASLAELMQRLTEQTSSLARQELELAKAEAAQKGKLLGIGAGAFGTAGVVAMFALGALTAAVILALAEAVAGWLAALIVAAVYGLIAGVLALAGRKQVEAATPPVPERAIESTRADIDAAKAGAKEGRNG
jgi:MFS family permease